jgi:hypothetical protein
MDANRYMTEIVEPTISDFEANPTSVRHAFLACVVTFHSIDYLTYPKKSGSRRKSFRKNSPEFATVDRIAHAFKHVHGGDDREAHFQPLKAADVIERPPASWGKAVSGLTRWGDAIGGVTIKNPRIHCRSWRTAPSANLWTGTHGPWPIGRLSKHFGKFARVA